MTDQKAKLIHVLNQCQFNKSFQERRKLDAMINQVCQDSATLYDIKHHSDYVHITLWNSNNDLITIAFFDDNHIILCLSCGCDYRMFNDGYNIQYSEIKSLLIKDNNQ